VNNRVHRLLHLGGNRHHDGSEVVDASSETAGAVPRRDMFTPYSMRKGERNETVHQERNPTPESGGDSDKVPVVDGRTEVGRAEQVGEQVTAVLASAEQAAEQIRESARQEADRIQTEAKDKAAATLHKTTQDAERGRRESEKLRADADAYSKETREAADRYVAEARVKIDREAAQRRAEVDEQVVGIQRAAERKARNLETEALHRQKALVRQVGHAEVRLQQMLQIFRGMTQQLEGLVGTKTAVPAGDAANSSVDEPLDEALKPRRSPSRST